MLGSAIAEEKVVRVTLGLVMGLFAGFLFYMACGMLFVAPEQPSGGFVAVTFLGGTVAFTWLVVRGTTSLNRVLSRGLLLGAAEWLVMAPLSVMVAGKAVAETTSSSGSDAGAAGAVLGGGIIASMGVGVSVVMMFICLGGFLVVKLLGQEMKPEVQ